MCKSKMSVGASQPSKTPTRASRGGAASASASASSSSTSSSLVPKLPPSTSGPSTSYSTGTSSYELGASKETTATASVSSRTSLSSLRDTLPESPHIYDFAEIRSATNSFLARRHYSSSTPSWRCNLRGKDVIVFQRKLSRSLDKSQLKEKLSLICRSHHTSIVKLLGVSISGSHIFFVYDFVKGASLSDCLRNPKNPNFSVLSDWMSRMQIATDVAHGLEYIHSSAIGINLRFVHKHIKSSSVIVSEPSFNAKICHFGAAELCGETETAAGGINSNEIEVETPPKLPQFQGVTGYMSPEFQSTGIATQSSDVYAFGVLILELISGHEPVKYKFDKTSGEYRKMSLVDAAKSAVEGEVGAEEVEVRLRRWVDRRLKDSFPVTVAEKMVKLAIKCSLDEPEKRPSMPLVAGKISKLYLDSRKWSEKLRIPTDFSYSFNPR